MPGHEPTDIGRSYVGAAKWTCWIVGAVFILVALLGFFSGDDLVLGIFMVNTLHNIVHLVSGALLVAVGFLTEAAARITLWVFAAIYGLVMLLGFLGVEPAVELLHLNMADNWLHLLLTLLFVSGALLSHAQARGAVDRRIAERRA
jgi:hypothetical protein